MTTHPIPSLSPSCHKIHTTCPLARQYHCYTAIAITVRSVWSIFVQNESAASDHHWNAIQCRFNIPNYNRIEGEKKNANCSVSMILWPSYRLISGQCNGSPPPPSYPHRWMGGIPISTPIIQRSSIFVCLIHVSTYQDLSPMQIIKEFDLKDIQVILAELSSKLLWGGSHT